MTHNLQSTNRGRLVQAARRLVAEGYEIAEAPWTQDGWHVVTFWSFRNQLYQKVSKSAHKKVLRTLKIPVHIGFQTHDTMSTEAMVAASSRTLERGARSVSPRRLRTGGM